MGMLSEESESEFEPSEGWGLEVRLGLGEDVGDLGLFRVKMFGVDASID